MKYIFKNKLLKILSILLILLSYDTINFTKSFAQIDTNKACLKKSSSKDNLAFENRLVLLKNPFLAEISQPKTKPLSVIPSVPVIKPPVLKGIIQNNDHNAAIIEYSGKSDFYVTGQTLGPYQITDITADSVTYSDCNTTHTISIEGN